MTIRPSLGYWILPCPVLLGVASASFGWLERNYPAMLRLCLHASVLGIVCCLCSIFFHSEPGNGDLERYFFHTLGMSGFLVCALITLKLLGPVSERSQREAEQRRQLFNSERREFLERRIQIVEKDNQENSGEDEIQLEELSADNGSGSGGTHIGPP